MSGDGMSNEDHVRPPERHCGDDVAAYALNALDPAEVASFRAHLETCSICRDELAAFQGVVDTLPLAAPAHRAPARLRRRVLTEVGTGRQRAPRRWAVKLGAGGWLRPALAAAAVLAVVVLVALRLASGPSYRLFVAHVPGPGRAELRVRSGHGELILRNFAPPPPGEIYEVWVKRGAQAPQPTSALFSVTTAGAGDVDVPGSLRRLSTVMVTPEPQGGSRVPTHPPVLTVSIS